MAEDRVTTGSQGQGFGQVLLHGHLGAASGH